MELQTLLTAVRTAKGAIEKGVRVSGYAGVLKGAGKRVTLNYAGPGDLATDVEWFFETRPRARALSASPELAFIATPLPLLGADVDTFYPYLNALLPVEPSVEAQIAAVRSKPHRRRLRAVRGSNDWSYRVQRTREALDHFVDHLHIPFVAQRFGERANLPNRAQLWRRFRKSGLVVEVLRGERVLSGALLFHDGSTLDYDRNGFITDLRSSPVALADQTAAVELAIFHVAQELGVKEIDVGFCRSFLRCGLYTHKRRLGCHFRPAVGLPAFRLKLPHELRPAFFSAVPMVCGQEVASVARLGLVDQVARRERPDWKSLVRNLKVPSVKHIEVWTNAAAERVELFVGFIETFAPGRTLTVHHA